MSKIKQTRETARTMVNPLFAWSNAVLKGGEMVLDSMAAAAQTAKKVSVAVLPESDAPRSRPARKASGKKTKAKRARRR
ncbi:MAG TPA: hypothetical protein VM140_03980 [Burkholderiales bacterium]|nr:hypothetical protein [Burkholderiales bacterium]